MAVLTADFERRYGVKVNVWRASSVKVLQRAAARSGANRWTSMRRDLVARDGSDAPGSCCLQEVRSRHHADLASDAMPSHRAGSTIPERIRQAYKHIPRRKEDLPKSYAELPTRSGRAAWAWRRLTASGTAAVTAARGRGKGREAFATSSRRRLVGEERHTLSRTWSPRARCRSL